MLSDEVDLTHLLQMFVQASPSDPRARSSLREGQTVRKRSSALKMHGTATDAKSARLGAAMSGMASAVATVHTRQAQRGLEEAGAKTSF